MVLSGKELIDQGSIKMAVSPALYHPKMIVAKRSHVAEIASWIQNEEELRWLGGEEGKLSFADNVEQFMRNADGAFVVEVRTSTAAGMNASTKPIAFFAIQPVKSDIDQAREFGRLIVKPDYRDRGLGKAIVKTVIDKLCSTSSAEREVSLKGKTVSYPQISLLARCLKDNDVGQKLFSHTWMSLDEKPWLQKKSDGYAIWYSFLASPKVRVAPLLKTYRKYNRKWKLTQGELGERIGTHRQLIAQYESCKNKKLPSLQTLTRYVKELELNSDEKAALLFALINESAPTQGIKDGRVELDRYQKFYDLWIASDEFYESEGGDALRASAQAISNGFDRAYFIREDTWGNIQATVVNPISRLVRPKGGNVSGDALVNKHLKVIAAPVELYALRLALVYPPIQLSREHNPRDQQPKTIVTAGGLGGSRFDVLDDGAQHITKKLVDIVLALGKYPSEKIDGYKQLFPDPEKPK